MTWSAVVSADAMSICEILDTLKEFLEGNKDSDLPKEIVQSLHIPLENTRCAVEDLVDEIKPFVNQKGELKKSKLDAIEWSYYQKDIKQLGVQPSNGKSTLNMTLAVVNVYSLAHVLCAFALAI